VPRRKIKEAVKKGEIRRTQEPLEAILKTFYHPPLKIMSQISTAIKKRNPSVMLKKMAGYVNKVMPVFS
jgi:hypothetical protein